MGSSDTNIACPACGARAMQQFFAIDHVPVHCNVFRDSETEARNVAFGDIRLAVCTSCGLVHNVAFDPASSSTAATTRPRCTSRRTSGKWAGDLADRLVERFDLRGRLAVEIGCGKGEFLAMLVERGARGLGFDEGYAGELGEDSPTASRSARRSSTRRPRDRSTVRCC
jgi:hypothetical protein